MRRENLTVFLLLIIAIALVAIAVQPSCVRQVQQKCLGHLDLERDGVQGKGRRLSSFPCQRLQSSHCCHS